MGSLDETMGRSGCLHRYVVDLVAEAAKASGVENVVEAQEL